MRKANQLPQNWQKQRKGKMSFAEHQPCARNHFEHSSSMVGIDVPTLDMRKQSFRLDNLAKVMESTFICVQDYFFWGCPAPGGKKNTLSQTGGEDCFSLVAGTMQLPKFNSSHPPTHTSISLLSSQTHLLELIGRSQGRTWQVILLTVFLKKTMGQGPEISFSICQNWSV